MNEINRMDLRQPSYTGVSKKKEEDKNTETKDQVTLGGEKADNWNPKLIVGAFTGRLGPQIPSGPPQWPAPIGIEIKDGIGIGLDGESIIVSHHNKNSEISIQGHLEDGTYPQRDFKVTRDGNNTKIDGFYNWQDYTLTQKGNSLEIDGETIREDYKVTNENGKTIVKGDYPVQNYVISNSGNNIKVDGYENMDDYLLTMEGNVTKIKGPFEERDFTITNKGNEITVDGHYAYQDFTIKKEGNKVTIQGYYPQQKYVITFNDK
jgi:hypothetical protein